MKPNRIQPLYRNVSAKNSVRNRISLISFHLIFGQIKGQRERSNFMSTHMIAKVSENWYRDQANTFRVEPVVFLFEAPVFLVDATAIIMTRRAKAQMP